MGCAEALACGLPTVLTNASGLLEFAVPAGALLVASRQVPLPASAGYDSFLRPWLLQRWALVDITDLRRKMRQAYKLTESERHIGAVQQQSALIKFSRRSVGEVMQQRLLEAANILAQGDCRTS